MRAAFESFPSPSMGRVRVGVRSAPLPPHPYLPPPRGEGVFTYLYQRGKSISLPLSAPKGEDTGG
jgi:hypothetical protein